MRALGPPVKRECAEVSVKRQEDSALLDRKAHHSLIGELNTETNRNLLKLYVLECLRQEPRLEAIASLEVRPVEGRERRGEVQVHASLIVKDHPDPLNLVIPFSFEALLG